MRPGWATAGLLTGLAGILVAVALPFAPVIGQSTVLHWPKAGQQPRPTTAFFVPYRPAELHATLPCRVLRAALPGPGRTTVLATAVSGGADALVVEAAAGRLRVVTDRREVPVELPDGRCELRIDATGRATTISLGGSPVARLAGARVPEVFAFTTDLDARAAAGMSVTARTPYWFASTPTGWKYGLLAAQAVLVAAALALLARRGRPGRRTRAARPPRRSSRSAARRPPPGRWRRAGTDAAVPAVLAGWGVIGPLTDDDGFAAMIARNAEYAGDPGNYYRWFNASEAPFALGQQVIRVFTEAGIAPLWLRVPSLLAGAATWLVLHRWVLHRWVLPRALPQLTRSRWLGPVAAVCFLAWWLPYGLGTRPEPFVALGTTLVLALALHATSPAAGRPLLAVGFAVLGAAVTLAVAPTGLLAAVPLLLAATGGMGGRAAAGSRSPGIWRLVRADAGRVEVAARVALLGAVAASVLTLMFADQSWHGVRVATEIHRSVGPNLPWFAEPQRYSSLLGADSWGSAGKRLPVLLTLALVLPVLALVARHGRSVLDGPRHLVLLGGAPVGLLLLALAPSKWSHHFGALAGLGSAFLVAAITTVLTAAGRHRRDPATVAIGAGGGILVGLAAGLAFAGPNTWWAYSDLGMPGSDSPQRPLHHPLLWLAVAGVAAAALALRRRRRDRGLPALAGVSAAPALLAALAAATSVGLLLSTFTAAPIRRGEGYSLAAQNLAGLTGAPGCGVEDHLRVLRELPDGGLRPAEGTDALDGSLVPGGFPDSTPPPGARPGWGSATAGPLGTGSLTSAWFRLPALPADQVLGVWVAGRLGGGNSVTLEFGRGATGGAVVPLGRRPLRDPATTERAYAATEAHRRQRERQQEQQRAAQSWRIRSVEPGELPEGADRVRVLVVDGSVGARSWIATTGPRRFAVTGLRDFLDARGPVLVDWPIAFVLPCRRDVPVVAGGLAEAPAAILAVPGRPPPLRDRWSDGSAWLAYSMPDAGSFAGVYQVGRVSTVQAQLIAPSRPVGAEPSRPVGAEPGRPVGAEDFYWGRVQVVDYRMARDAYDTYPVRRRLSGWAGDDGYRF